MTGPWANLVICAGLPGSGMGMIAQNLFATAGPHQGIQADINSALQHVKQLHFSCQEPVWAAIGPNDAVYDDFIGQLAPLSQKLVAGQTICSCDEHNDLLLEAWRVAAPEAKYLLFFSEPATALARQFRSSSFRPENAEAFLSSWSIRAEALLDFYFRYREQSLLVDEAVAEERPEGLKSLLASRWAVEPAALEVDATALPRPAREPISAVLALPTLNLINPDDYALQLHDELVSAADLSDDNGALIRSRQERIRSLIPAVLGDLQLLERARQDLALMQLQKEQLTDELETVFSAKKTTEELLQKLSSHLAGDPLLKLSRLLRSPES